jgi:hypothetical protein
MAKGLSNRYISALLRTVREPSVTLDALKQSWPAVESELAEKRVRVDRRIPDDDPIRFPVDLLGPLDVIEDETRHTRALAYLLDPSQSHGLEKSVLREILQKTKQAGGRSEAPKILGLLQGNRTRISVTPEYRYRIEGHRGRSVARADIWVELKTRTDAALIVVENKINAPEASGQLGWYERKARDWCKKHKGHASQLLIFLTRDQTGAKSSDSGQWVALSYLRLAAALRTVWLSERKAAGRPWLGLYISSITRGLLGLDVRESADVTEIEEYLGEAQ